MKFLIPTLSLFLLSIGFSAVTIDEAKLGESLGGWTKRGGKSAEYELSGVKYRTYKPEVTPTPDGGIFVSVRIDHVRGVFSSDDHAMLEITVDSAGQIVSAQTTIAIQGRSVASDLIRGSVEGGQKAVGVDRAVEIGTSLVADVSAKLLRERVVEAGRVSFPALLRHNYNLLYQAIKVDPVAAPKATAEEPAPNPPKKSVDLEYKGFGEKSKTEKK